MVSHTQQFHFNSLCITTESSISAFVCMVKNKHKILVVLHSPPAMKSHFLRLYPPSGAWHTLWTASRVSRSEVMPVCQAPWEEIGFVLRKAKEEKILRHRINQSIFVYCPPICWQHPALHKTVAKISKTLKWKWQHHIQSWCAFIRLKLNAT